MNRRHFLRQLALASTGLSLTGLHGLPAALAAGNTPLQGYRALICVFLYGGADSHNLLVPTDAEPWQTYRRRRSVLALNRDSLLPLAGQDNEGMAFGLHPGCEALQRLFADGELSFVRNVGALRQPVTLSEARNDERLLPAQLFSHADQQVHWMRGESYRQQAAGWGGRLQEMLADRLPQTAIAPAFSLGFTNPWQTGETSIPFILTDQGVSTPVESYSPEHTALMQQAYRDLLLQARSNGRFPLRQLLAERVEAALDNAHRLAGLLAEQPPLDTPFPDTAFGRNLAMVARIIALREALGHSRQLFFVGLPGWDTHDRQLQDYPLLVKTLSDGLGALVQALKSEGVFEQVTTFTASDFGRTLTANGDGSDHGWGSHQLVISGSLSHPGHVGRFPQLAANGPDDFGAGRLLPSIATAQYHASLARWFGLEQAELTTLFPELGTFTRPTLDYLKLE